MRYSLFTILSVSAVFGAFIVHGKHQRMHELRDSLSAGTKPNETKFGDAASFLQQAKEEENFNTARIPPKAAAAGGCALAGEAPALTRTAISPDQIFSEEDVLTGKELSAPRKNPLYRGDSRPFRTIFSEGFKPRSPFAKMSLLDHVGQAANPEETQWISTTDDFNTAGKFIYPSDPGYLYEIYKPGGIPVSSVLNAYKRTEPHVLACVDSITAREVLFSTPIEPRFIKGAWSLLYKGPYNQSFRPGKFFPNPYFRPN